MSRLNWTKEGTQVICECGLICFLDDQGRMPVTWFRVREPKKPEKRVCARCVPNTPGTVVLGRS